MNKTMSKAMSKPMSKPIKVIGHFINGNLVADSNNPHRSDITNPATAAVIQSAALASDETLETAIDAAQHAFPAWRDTPPSKRARVLFRYKQLLEEHAEAIVALITQEHGKVLSDAMGELQRGIEIVEYACGAPELLKGEYAKNVAPGMDCWSEFQPLGVVVGITPFNFPAMVPLWMFPMAIACGNTFILKPSEKTPSAALLLADLFSQAGLPDGVFNVVNGDKSAVNYLLQHPVIEAVSFVGSTPVAESIYQTASAQGKRVQALGGAKNHAVILPDADIENAAKALMGAAYGSCGERCMAISVAVCVGDETADALANFLTDAIAQLNIGVGTDAASEMGPLITQSHYDNVRATVDSGVTEGASLVIDGRDLIVEGHEQGFFLGPCLFDHVTAAMRIYQEEIFGPVLCIVRVNSLAAAMQLIDAHQYGNGTCLFTRDGEAARYFTDNIRVGMVGVNVPLPVPAACHSFGGWKRSLFGDLYAYGPDSIRFYTRRKTITQRWPSGSVREEVQLAFPS